MNLHSQEKTLILGLLVCGLVAMVGTSFAYFTGGGVRVIGRGSSVDVNTATTQKVTYDAGTSTLNLQNAYPGMPAVEKDFTIKLTPGTDSKNFDYTIKLAIDSNGFTKCNASGCNELEVVLIDATSGSDSVLKTVYVEGETDDVVLHTEHKTNVTTETTLNYKLKVQFKEVGQSQNHNMSKSLRASLKVEFASAE